MYATALLAPVFWMALVDPPSARAFPSKVSHMLLILVIDMIAGAFFGLATAHHNVNPEFIVTFSGWVFLTALFLLYLGTVYHTNRMPDPSEEFRKQEGDFSAAYEEHRK
jgi:ribose/xylose/arabinose/galactoside ABC-type transport system permease subunit